MEAKMASDTKETLGTQQISNRSLWFDRFAEPKLKKEDRQKWFEAIASVPHDKFRANMWKEFLFKELNILPSDILFMKLNARLIVNSAVGVIENAGLCLDRFSGLPFIPGSAVKGCARRMAIQRLKEAPDEISKKDILEKATLMFGWNASDWSTGNLRGNAETPDFRWACSETLWPQIASQTRASLSTRLNTGATFPDSYAGCVRFLPAYPLYSPKKDIEIDVITCHHQQYYSNPQKNKAEDNEDPNPVFFPAVAPEHVFCFAVMPDNTRAADSSLLEQAKTWLNDGLTDFGLGAKTNAGYGWFKNVSKTFSENIAEEFRKQEEIAKKEAEREAQKQTEEESHRKRKEEEEKKAKMTPEQLADYEVQKWNDDKLRGRLSSPEQFLKLDSLLQTAVVRLLAEQRTELWLKIKQDAESKKVKTRQPAVKIRDEIYKLAKTVNPRIKMP